VANIRIRERALRDLSEIWSYIAEDSQSHADRLALRVDRTFKLLSRRPEIGRRRPELYPELRSLTVGDYVIFYLPMAKGIDVIRVLHGARDIESMFDDEP
jgi:toxin ParE1/3/4